MASSPANSHGNGYPLGLAGSVLATRYVGGTATVAPTTGTFAVGDFVISQNGKLWVCTVAGAPGTWVQVGAGGSGTVTSVTAADGSIVVGGTAADPTIATGTLDAIATAHPPAAAVALNAKKITGLANGSALTDAAAYGQVPFQYDRVAITSAATSTQTAEGSATALITGNAITPGAAVVVRIVVSAYALLNSSVSTSVLNIWRAIDGGAAVDIGRVAQCPAAPSINPLEAELYDTPGAGSIVYSVRGWVTGASTLTVTAGAGGAGAFKPATLSSYRAI